MGFGSQWQAQEAEKSPGRPNLQTKGHDTPMGGEQCQRGREQKPLSICILVSGRKGRDWGAQPLSALINASASSGGYQEIAATTAPNSELNSVPAPAESTQHSARTHTSSLHGGN